VVVVAAAREGRGRGRLRCGRGGAPRGVVMQVVVLARVVVVPERLLRLWLRVLGVRLVVVLVRPRQITHAAGGRGTGRDVRRGWDVRISHALRPRQIGIWIA
jgi:hypothetical protein